MAKNKHLKYILLLAFFSYLMFMFGNSLLSLTNPDEVFYSLTAKEMIQHNTWMTPYLFNQPQFEKPIFLYWALRAAFMIFGITSFSARFFPALFGIIGVIAIYLLAFLGFKDEKKAFLSGLVLMSGGLYIGLARTVFTDLIFTVFILLSLLSFFWGYVHKKRKALGLLLFFVFSALAVLSKGPLGFIIPFLTAILFLAFKKNIKFMLSWPTFAGFLIFMVISLPWYILMINKYGNSFIQEFFYNDHLRRIFEAEHISNDNWYFYPLSMIGCLFPWSLLLVAGLINLPAHLRKKNDLYLFAASWIVITFVIFQPAHSKLVSYIFPLFPALSLITAGFICDSLEHNKGKKLVSSLLLVNSLIFLILPIGVNIAAAKYTKYVPSPVPIYWFSIVISLLNITILFFLIKGKTIKGVYATALALPVFLSVIPFVHSSIEPYVSSRDSCKYLTDNHSSEGTILCSKFFARGVRFYTGKDVAVIDINGKQFFSPHPIPYLNSDDKVREFLSKQKVTYCVLKKSALGTIKLVADKAFKYTILKQIGDEYIVKIERLAYNR